MADYYVDYSSANDGTGGAANQAASGGASGAFNTFNGKTFVAGDKVWIRRAPSGTLSVIQAISASGVNFIGWPKSGDDYYSSRPASGTSNGWDSDSPDQTVLTFASTSFYVQITGANNKIYRLKSTTTVASGKSLQMTSASYSNFLIDCAFSGTNATSNPSGGFIEVAGFQNTFIRPIIDFYLTGTSGGISISGSGNRFQDITLTITSFSASSPIMISGKYNTLKTLTVTISGASSSPYLITISGSYNRIYDCTITSTVANSTYLLAVFTGFENHIYNINGANCSAGSSGCIQFNTSSNANNFIYAKNITMIGAGSYGVYVNGGNTNKAILKSVVFNCTTLDVSMFGDGCQFLLDNCKFSTNPPVSFFNNSITQHGGYTYSANHNQQTGYWKAYMKEGVITASNTLRTGGGAFSVRFEPNRLVTASPDALQYGLIDSQSTYITLTAGSRTITVYGAYKFFNSSDPPDKRSVWFETEHLKTSGDVEQITTQASADLESDASTWTNDTGLTKFKITKTFTVQEDCVVPIRIFVRKYYGNGYLYIDPVFVVS